MGDGITINEIIDRAMMQQSALSRALMNMEKEDYVRRVLRRDDARYVEVFLTDKGRALFNSLNIVVRRRQAAPGEGFLCRRACDGVRAYAPNEPQYDALSGVDAAYSSITAALLSLNEHVACQLHATVRD